MRRWLILGVLCCAVAAGFGAAEAGAGSSAAFTTFGAPFTGESTLISNLPGSAAGPTGLLEVGSTLYTVDGDTGTMYRFGLTGGDASQTSHVYSSADGLSNGIAQADGVYYAGSRGEGIDPGVYMFNPATLARGNEVAHIANVNEITTDPKTGDLYVTAYQDGLYRIQNPSSALPTVTEVAVGDFAGIGLTYEDGQGVVWVADVSVGGPSVQEFSLSSLQTASTAADCTPSMTTDCATPMTTVAIPASSPQQLPIGIAVYPDYSTVGTTDVSGDVMVTTAQGNTDAPGEVLRIDVGHNNAVSVVASGTNASRGDAAIIDSQGYLDLAQTTSVIRLIPASPPRTFVIGGPNGVDTLADALVDAGQSDASNVVIELPGEDTQYAVSGLRIDPPPGATWTIEGEGNTAEQADIESPSADVAPVLIIGAASGRSGQVNLEDIEVSGADNAFSTGGGIEVEPGASLDVSDSYIDGNTTGGGGGGILDKGALTVENSTFADNSAETYGGGIDYALGATGDIVNSTFVDNNAADDGAAIAGSTSGPTDATDPGVDVLDATIADNDGGADSALSGDAVANVVGTIFEQATYDDGESDCDAVRAGISGGDNIADDDSCGLTAGGDQQNENADLVRQGDFPQLAYSGGPTPTIATTSSSPARDGQTLDCPATDQTGAPRTTGAGPCDVGAVQSGATAPTIGCPPAADAYADAVLADSPLAYFPLSESAGTFACDASGNGTGSYSSTGVGYGVPGPLASDPGQTAVSGDGTDSNDLALGDPVPLSGNQSFTLEGWFRATTPINETVVTLNGGSVAGMAVWSTHTACGAGSNNNGSALALDEYGESNCWDTTPNDINLFDGNWHYLAITFDPSSDQMTGYVDGVDLGAETPSVAFNWSSPQVSMGFWVDHSVNQPFTGDMAQVAVYPTALSSADVTAHETAATSGGTTTTGTGTTTTGTGTGTTTTGTGTTTTGTGTTTTGTGTGTTPVTPPTPTAPDLSISVSQGQAFTAGSTSSYDVQIANRGTASTTGAITVTATLPAGVSYTSATGDWSCVQGASAQEETCKYGGGAITTGDGVALQINVSVAADAVGGEATFTVSDTGDSHTGDKTATSPTTIGPASQVSASVSGPGLIQAGIPSDFKLNLQNTGSTAIAAGDSVNFTVAQEGVAQLTLGPSASGSGWTCSTVTIDASAVVHCTAAQPLAPGAATVLALSFDPPLSASGTRADVSYTLQSVGGATLVSGSPQTLSVSAPGPAALAATLEGPSALKTGASDFAVAVSNTGSGTTTGPTVVTLSAPSQVLIGAVTSSGWTCTTAGSTVACTDPAPIASGHSAPSLVVPLIGTAGAPSPDGVSVSVTSQDAQGPVVAHAAVTVTQPVAGSSAPVVRVQKLSASTTSTSFSVTVSNNGDGASGTTPLELIESLPAGVTATAVGTGWSCSQASTTLSCRYSSGAGAVLGSGASTSPLDVRLTGVADFSGESVPVSISSSLTSSDGVTHKVSVPASLTVQAQPAPPVVQATLSTALSSTSPGGTVDTTFGLQAGPAAVSSTGVVAVGFVVPQGVGIPLSAYWHDGVHISQDDQIPSSGSTSAPVPVSSSSGPGMSCEGFGTYVVCAAPSLAANSEVNVQGVPITFPSTAAGSQTLTAGIVPVTATTVSAAITAASAAVAAGGVSALQSPQTAVIDVPVFSANAGANQRLDALSGTCTQPTQSSEPTLGSPHHLQLSLGGSAPATGCTLGATQVPTSVNLDGSGTVGDGRPLTYAWVQVAGPAVTWAASAAGQTPGQGGSTLPALPPGAGKIPPGATLAHGPRVSFTYADASTLTAPTNFSFRLVVTDGTQVRVATTTVELDPPPPAPPVTPKLCLWDYTQTHFLLPGGCLSSTSPAPKPGDVIVAGSYSPFLYATDTAGDPLTYTWSVTDPTFGGSLVGAVGWHLTPANGSSAPNVCRTTVAIARTGPAYCFEWPSGVSVLGLSASVSNGRTDAQGDPEKAVAGVTYGSTPPPVTVTVPPPVAPAAAGSSVSVKANAAGAGAGATYSWIQTGGPKVPGLPTTTSSSTLEFTAPTPSNCTGSSSTDCGQAVTLQVVVTEGSGTDASTGEATVTVPLAPAAPLAVTVTAPTMSSFGQVALSAPASTLLSASPTGTVAGTSYAYTWTVASGSGTLTPSASGRSATYSATTPGIATVTVTVTATGGVSATATIPIVVSSSSSSSSTTTTSTTSTTTTSTTTTTSGSVGTTGVCTGLLGSIINQVFPNGASLASGTAVLSAGPVTLDLPSPTLSGPGSVGSSIGCTLPIGDTLTFTGATVTVGPFTLSNLSASVSLTDITLTGGTVTAPSNWNLGQGTISKAIDIPLDGSPPTGAITWTQSSSSSGLPVLPAGSTVTNASTTVTLGASSATLSATADLLKGVVTANATIPWSTSGAATSTAWGITFATTTPLQVLGIPVRASGTLTYDDGSFTGAVTATAGSTQNPIEVGPVNVTSATLTWNSSGISLSASGWALGTSTKPVINLSFSGSYEDSDNWSATATGSVANNPQGLPSGVNLLNASITGSVVDQGGAGPIFDVKLADPSPLTITAGSASMSFSNLVVEVSNGPPATACAAVGLPESSGDVWITLGGTASVTLGSAAPVSVSATACVDPSSGSFGLSATGFDNWSPVSGVTFTSLNLTVSYTDGALQALANGEATVDGVQVSGAVAFIDDDGPQVIAIAAVPNLSQLGLPLGNTAGVAVFSSEEITDLGSPSSDSPAQQAVLPQMFCGLSQGQWDGTTSTCTGATETNLSEGRFAGVEVNGLALAASFTLPASSASALDTALGQTVNPAFTISVDLGAAIPTITGTLSAPNGGFTVLHVGPNRTSFPVQIGPLSPSKELPGAAFTLNLQSVDVQIGLDGSLSLGAQATITMPSPTSSGSSTAPGAPAPTSCADPGSAPQNSSDDCAQLGLAAAITLDVAGPTITLAGTVDGCDTPGSASLLCNALGVQGLDIGDLSVQLGVDFSTTPIPTPTFGFAAAINAIPCSWASIIGYGQQNGCNGSSGTPIVGPTPALSIAVNLSDTGPIFAFQIGAPNSTTPILRFGNALTVDEASLVIAPAGGTIGAGSGAVTYQPGFSLSFNGAVLGVPLLVKASVDPSAGTIAACANVGTISVGGLTVKNASFNFELGVSTTNQCATAAQLSSSQVSQSGGAGAGLVLGFTGDISVAGGVTVNAALSLQATSAGDPTVSLYADVGNLDLLDNTVDVNALVLKASGTFNPNPPSGQAPFSFNVQGTGSMRVLGNSINVAGAVDLTSDGIQSLSFYANPANSQFSLAGQDLASLTGPGCQPEDLSATVPAVISESTSGPCIGVSYTGSGSDAFQVTLAATAQVAGISVTFDGTAGTTGIDITNASASIPGAGSVEFTGQIWLDSGTLGAAGGGGSGAGNLAGTQWLDPVSNQEVSVAPGDFELTVATPTPITLAGISLNVNFEFGYLGSDVYATGSSELSLPGGSYVNLNGTFCSSGGNFGFSLGANLAGLSIDGFGLSTPSTATLADSAPCLGPNSPPTGLQFQIAFDPTPITDSNGNTLVSLKAYAGGAITEANNALTYSLNGGGTLDLFGVELSGGFSLSNSSGSSLANLPFSGGQPFGLGISFSGSAAVSPDGDICGLQGSATIAGITGTASFCDSGGTAAVTVGFMEGDLAITGTVDGPTWTLTASDHGSLSIDATKKFLGATWGVDSSVSYNVTLTVTVSPTGVTVTPSQLSGQGTLNAELAGNSIANGSVTLSGQPPDVCGTAYAGGPFGTTVGSAEVCDNNGTVEVEELSGPFSTTPPSPPFPSLPWTV